MGKHQNSVLANNAASLVDDVLHTNISAVTRADKNCASVKAAGKKIQEKLEQFCFSV